MAMIDRVGSRFRSVEEDDGAAELIAQRRQAAAEAAAAKAAADAAAKAAADAAAAAAATVAAQAPETTGSSQFQAPAATPAATAAPPTEAPPVAEGAAAARSTEFATMVGSGTTKAADFVRNDTQVEAIVQAAKPEEAAAVRAHFEAAPADDVKKAFTNVLDAAVSQGTRPVTLGPFVGSVTVDAAGAVNGKALASDQEVNLGSKLAHLSHDDRKESLRQYGVPENRLNLMSEDAVRSAFNSAELRRLDGPGTGSISVPAQPMGRGQVPATTVSFQVGEAGALIKNGAAVRPASEAALARVAEIESKEWPGGTPESRLRTRIEDVALEVNRSDKIATILSALPADEAARLHATVHTHPGVSEASLQNAYQSVLDARKTPGSKTLDLSLTQMREETWYGGEGDSGTTLVEGAAVSFRGPIEVSEDGKINGKRLDVDEYARLSSQLATVPAEAKEAALKEAGLDDNWMGQASQAQKDTALAKLRHATMTPGSKNIDLSFSVTTTTGGESETTSTHTVSGSLRLEVGADGKVNGKTPAIETALATTLTFERLSMNEKRLMLGQLGVGAAGLKAVTANEASDILTRVALRTKSPGDQQFDVSIGGKTWVMGIKVGEKGEIQGAGAMEKPQPPKQKWYKKWLGPILTIASFVFPPAAPFLQAANAVLAIKNGAKGLGLIAAVAGAVAGVGNIAGFSSVASVASTVANVAGAANGIHQGIKTGNFLGAISSVVSLAGQVGGLTNTDLGSNWSIVETAGKVAGYASRALSGDFAGLVAEGVGAAVQQHRDAAADASYAETENQRLANRAATVAAEADTAATASGDSSQYALGDARFGDSGSSTVRLGTGDDGASLGSDQVGPTASQADVRRVDNEIDASRPQTRADFDRAFAGARQNGERVFTFDMNDGRGPQRYTTGTREEVAAAVPGGSTNGYREFLTATGMRDSDASLTAYRAAVAPRPAEPLFPNTPLTGVVDGTGFTGFDGPSFADLSQRPAGDNGLRVSNSTSTADEGIDYGAAADAMNGSPSSARVRPANTGSDLADSVIDRVNTIGTNLGTVIRGTGVNEIVNGARSLYGAAVNATSRGMEYLAETSVTQMGRDASSAASRAATAIRENPAGAAWAAFNAIVPVGDIYEGVSRLGDEELSYAEATSNVVRAGFGVAGVVGLGAVGTAARTASALDDVAGMTARVSTDVSRDIQHNMGRTSAAEGGTHIPSIDGPVPGRTSISPLTTSMNPAEQVADVQRSIDGWRESGARLDLELYSSFDSTRRSTTTFRTEGGSAEGRVFMDTNGGLGVAVRSDLLDYERLPGGLEVVGMDRTLAATLNHELRGHGVDLRAMQADPTQPYLLRIESGDGLPGHQNGAMFSENNGWVESSAAARRNYVDAVAAGDGAAATRALAELNQSVTELQSLGRRFTEVSRNAATPESQALIAQSARPRMVESLDGSPARPLGGVVPGTMVVDFDIIENGRRVSMTTEVPTTVRSSAEAVAHVNAQLQASRTQLDGLARTYQALERDRIAINHHAQASGATAAQPAAVVANLSGQSSTSSTSALLGDVWRARQAGERVDTNAVYGMYNRVTEPNPLSRSNGSFISTLADIADGRPPGSVSSLQNIERFFADGSINDPQFRTNQFRVASRQPDERRATNNFYRFEQRGADLDTMRDRIYINASADSAPELMRRIVERYVDSGQYPSVGMAKIAGPGAVGARAENIVIYTSGADTDRILRELGEAQSAHPEMFQSTTPAMTERIRPGIAYAQEPINADGNSFGGLRADLIAQALRDARSEAEFQARVRDLFRQNQIDPDAPFRNLPGGP